MHTKKYSERQVLGVEEDRTWLSGPFSIPVGSKAGCMAACLARQVNKVKQSPGATAGEYYHFEGSQKNWHILAKNSQKEAINYPLSQATAWEKVNLKTGIVSK